MKQTSSHLGKKMLFALAAVVLLAAGCSKSGESINTTPSSGRTPTPSVKDASDASLNADLKSSDSQLNALNSDSANMDSSLNEQQAP